ncbi:MAG: hypothetical protein CMJ17_03945 [Phenylobacterium sp.]|nr:hypothetical protein [Phenylobacterium sp.]
MEAHCDFSDVFIFKIIPLYGSVLITLPCFHHFNKRFIYIFFDKVSLCNVIFSNDLNGFKYFFLPFN